MKHQRSNLNTLPSLPILRPRNMKRRMRHPSSPPIKLRIKALDKKHFLRRKSRFVEPPKKIPLSANTPSLSKQRIYSLNLEKN
jgi:SOS-response transcriptional repressor LexA